MKGWEIVWVMGHGRGTPVPRGGGCFGGKIP